eukprot:s2900_g2.t1
MSAAAAGTTEVPVPPSSEGSARSQNHVEAARPGQGSEFDEDEFDSDEFRSWMRNRGRQRRERRRQNDSEEDGHDDHRSSSGPPPEWDGESIPFLDYQIKANLWLATTKAKPRTRGPLLLQKLSKTPFEAMKHLARDQVWMVSDQNGEELLRLMNLPENFGDDQEEDLLSSLAKITYHLRRGKDEGHRAFFSKWDQATRKVAEHRVTLPDQYMGFLLINALNLSESDIKSLLTFSRGSIRPPEVREWVRKHETKLQVSQVGVDRKSTTKASSTHYVAAEPYDPDEEEIHAVEEALRDLQDEDAENGTEIGDDDLLEEHEAAEILSTFLQQKRKSYTQTLKAKKAKELGRGYNNKWKTGRSVSATGTGVPPFREGQFKMTIEELKKVTKCGICHKTGHWHRECPEKDKNKNTSAKETHILETEEAIFCGHLQLSGQEELRDEKAEDAHEPSSGLNFVRGNLSNGGTGLVGDCSESCEYTAELHDHEVFLGEGIQFIDSRRTKTNPIPEEACATLDTGCQRMAVGKQTLENLLKHIPEDIPVKIHDQEHRFKSVHGKSCTKHVASIPTSIGKKGSFLKPAVFENEESVQAPFLISLPFLMACRTTLVLDPDTGLRAHLKKLGVTVPCHIGPTGALRVPFCEFSKTQLDMLKQEFHSEAKGKEFEILRTDHSGSVDPQPPALSSGDRDSDDGTQRQAPARGSSIHGSVDVAMHGQEDALRDPTIRPGSPLHGTTWTSTSTRRSTETAGEATIDVTFKGINLEHNDGMGDCDRRRGHTSHHHAGDPGDHGNSTSLRPQHGQQALCVLHREEQPTPVLAMLVPQEPPVHVLPMDQGTTSPGIQGVSKPEEGEPARAKYTHLAEPLSASQHQQEGHERPQDCGEVLGLSDSAGRAQDREGNAQGAGAVEQKVGQVGLPPGAPSQEQHTAHSRTCSSHAGIGCAGDRRCLDRPDGGQLGDSVSLDPKDLHSFGNKRSRRVLRQARAALTSAHEQWEDIMTCFKMPSPSSGEYLENFLCTIEPEHRANWGPRKIRRLASLLGVQKRQAKVVAEIYNPNRFGPRTQKWGLQKGEAFDLELGIQRSTHAAKYPRKILDTILSCYAKSISETVSEIHVTESTELLNASHRIDAIWHHMEEDSAPLQVLAMEASAGEEPDLLPEGLLDGPDPVPGGPDQEPGLLPEPDEADLAAESTGKALPLERPSSLEQLVRRAHCGLGHVGNERLASILKHAGAHADAIKIAKNLVCPTCIHHKRVDGARQAAPPRKLQPNQIVGVDTVWLPGIEPGGKLKMALNCICWNTRFQLMIPLKSHTPSSACKAFYQWIRVFGPPERVYCDLGREFKRAFHDMAAQNDFHLDPGALEAPTQRSITERAGRTFKEILSKTLMQTGCTTWDEWHDTVDIVCATVNRLANKSGFSPMQRMLGFNPRMPGSILSGGEGDHSAGSLYVAGDAQVQRAMEIKKQAAIAYHEADCSQALRHAIHAGPKKFYDFTAGQTVYFWRKGMDRQKKDSPAYWHGPAKVVLTDLPSTVWVTYNGYLIKACPEHLRLASDDEKFILTDFISDILETKKHLDDEKIRGYIILEDRPPLEDMIPHAPVEGPEPPAPRYRLTGKVHPRDVDFKESNADSPEAQMEENQKRRRLDEEPDEARPPTDYEPSLAPTEELRNETKNEETEMIPPEELHPGQEEPDRGVVRPDHPEVEEAEEPPSKRIRTEFLEVMLTQLLSINQKKRKEVQLSKMTKKEKEKFQAAITKEIKTNLKSEAYEFLSREESEAVRRDKPEKIMKSRYVLTEKPIEPHEIADIRDQGLLLENDSDEPLKAKARHVMKGFSETGAEDLDSTTPQVAKESAFFVLQILASMAWILGHLDFTQAFHSGDRIQRELYAEIPTEGIPGIHPRQLLRLKKTCYGLTDGPYAWYCHISRVLLELGYEKSKADPCLFFLRDTSSGEIEGIIGLATDDMIHGGGDRHWKNMEWLRQSYQMGKFTTGSGKFTGKNLVPDSDGSININQQHYIENHISKITLEKGRRSQKFSRCTPKEVGDLRTLIGGLAWVAKETRPDIAGRVALLQQAMPHPMIRDILEGNAILEDLQKTSALGLKIQPIPLERLRMGVVSDASWGNAGPNTSEESPEDYWQETSKLWIRHHVQNRRLRFHPGGTPDGPDLHSISRARATVINGENHVDQWDDQQSFSCFPETWTGKTIFYKTTEGAETKKPMSEKFLQASKKSSQGGFLLFYYDSKMETSDRPEMMSIIGWKSYKLKRCTVNTLSAECQSMVQGLGQLHWHRFLLAELFGLNLELEKWEDQLSQFPFVAVTDSRSLYDTVTKCRNSSAHVDDKRTAIDLTILKNDLLRQKGQVRWVQGVNMIADSLTKKMSPWFLRKIMQLGFWTLAETGHELLVDSQQKCGPM